MPSMLAAVYTVLWHDSESPGHVNDRVKIAKNAKKFNGCECEASKLGDQSKYPKEIAPLLFTWGRLRSPPGVSSGTGGRYVLTSEVRSRHGQFGFETPGNPSGQVAPWD